MKDGELLQKMLRDGNKKWTDLRDAAGLSKARVYQIFKLDKFSANVREDMVTAMRVLKIDTTPLEAPREPSEISDPDELRQLLDGIPVESLSKIKRIMDATRGERLALGAIINERIARRK